jgi:hypothetical protein
MGVVIEISTKHPGGPLERGGLILYIGVLNLGCASCLCSGCVVHVQ